MRTEIDARSPAFRGAVSAARSAWARLRGDAAILLGAAAIAGLAACEDGPVDPGDGCEGPDCPPVAGPPVTVASPASDVIVHSLTLARSSDGAAVTAGWSELYDKERLFVAASSDGGATFGAPAQLTPPADADLSYIRLVAPDSGGMLAGAVAQLPDPESSFRHAWPRVYRSADTSASFDLAADLKSAIGDRSFTQGTFAASADGKTLVYAWVDTTPTEWLGPDSAPAGTLLVSSSTDSGATFTAPAVVSATPFLSCSRIVGFVRDGRAGIVYAEEREIAGQPVKVGVPALALAGEDGGFQEPVLVASDDYGAVPAGGAIGSDGAAPGAALGPDGSIHVAWWSARTVGLWYAVSEDGLAFSEPVRVLDTTSPTPANVRVSVDGTGAAWVAALDVDSVRVVQIPPGEAPVEIADAASPLGSTGDTFDIAGLPGEGAMQLWLGVGSGGDTATSLPIHLRVIAP